MWSRRAVHVLVLLAAFVFVSGAAAEPSFPAPPPGRAVSDTAGLIAKEDAAVIERIAAALRVEKTYPVGVVTIRSLAAQGASAYTIERYAAEMMRAWPDEGQMRSHGMLLVVAADNRTARIHLGSAWGGAHDGRARRVMDRVIVPAFRTGAFSAGIVDAVRGFDAMGRQQPLSAAGKPSWVPALLVPEGLDGPWWSFLALAGAAIVLVGIVASIAKGGRRSWGWAAAAFIVGLVLARILGRSAEASEAEGGATGSW
jgi:uncharacterized membrane protein YgcG